MGELFDKLANYGNSGIYPFHMPGHKRQKTVDFNPYKIDITEIEGFDNLHHAEVHSYWQAVQKANVLHFQTQKL